MRAAFGAWLSPVERTVRVREVPSSNLGAPTVQLPPSIADGGFVFGAPALRAAAPPEGRLPLHDFESILSQIFTPKEICRCTTPGTWFD